MPLFRQRSRALPATSYGYHPPSDAVASGWKCPACSRASEPHDGPPRRWPAACPDCGTSVDPWFRGTPWEHAAWGAEIQHKLVKDPEDAAGGGFHKTEWATWRFREGLLTHDAAVVRTARAELRAIVDADHWRAATAYYMLVWHALEAGETDMAAEELVYWFGVSTSEDVETDSGNRHNCRNAIESAMRFLDSPGGASHPLAPEIRRLCGELSAGAFPVLSRELQDQVVKLGKA